MLPIGNLLSRFKNLTNSEKVKKQLIVEIFETYKIPVKVSQISIQKNTIFIKTQPIIKTELFLKKEEIINEIKKIPSLGIISSIQ